MVSINVNKVAIVVRLVQTWILFTYHQSINSYGCHNSERVRTQLPKHDSAE